MTQVAKVIPLHGGGRRTAAGRPAESFATHPSQEPSAGGAAPLPPQHTAVDGFLDDLRTALIGHVTGGAEFLRRRITGDYEVDDFGFDPHFNDNILMPALRPCSTRGSASKFGGSRTFRQTVAHSSSRITRVPCPSTP